LNEFQHFKRFDHIFHLLRCALHSYVKCECRHIVVTKHYCSKCRLTKNLKRHSKARYITVEITIQDVLDDLNGIYRQRDLWAFVYIYTK